jgi:hypothetical protein
LGARQSGYVERGSIVSHTQINVRAILYKALCNVEKPKIDNCVKGSASTVGTRLRIDICTVGNEEADNSLRGVGELVGLDPWIAPWGICFDCSEQGLVTEALGRGAVCQEEFNHVRVMSKNRAEQGRFVDLALLIDIGASLKKEFGDFYVPFEGHGT